MWNCCKSLFGIWQFFYLHTAWVWWWQKNACWSKFKLQNSGKSTLFASTITSCVWMANRVDFPTSCFPYKHNGVPGLLSPLDTFVPLIHSHISLICSTECPFVWCEVGERGRRDCPPASPVTFLAHARISAVFTFQHVEFSLLSPFSHLLRKHTHHLEHNHALFAFIRAPRIVFTLTSRR